MSERPSSKRYEPPSMNLRNKNDSHTLIVELTGSNNLILEVGTSTGYLTKMLRDLGNRVIGVEIDEEAAESASQYCDLMITGDVEEVDLDEYLGPSSIDVAVFGDVLEHLKYPAQVLEKVKRYLKPQGSIVVSIPNVCHGDVLLNLLEGDFGYRSVGLLDETHLRFFGLKNVVDLLDGTGYSIKEIKTTRLPVGGTELRLDPEKMPRELVKFIEALPNSDVYQFVLRAKASDRPKNEPVAEADLKAIFDRSIEDLLSEYQQPLKLEIAEISAKYQGASERIAALNGEIQTEAERARLLEREVSERDGRIAELACELEGAADRVQSLDQTVSERDGKIAELAGELEKATEQVQSLGQSVSERDGKIAELERQIRFLENKSLQNKLELESIKESFTWTAVTKWHNTIVDRFLAQGTKRGELYAIGIKSLRIIQQGGLREFILKAKNYSCKRLNIPSKLYKSFDSRESGVVSKVDIIIPIYNSYQDIKKCIESVLSYTALIEYNIYLINDCSTDKRVLRYLEYMINNIQNLKVIHNSENLGFVKTVNKGAKLTNNDIVILNSDTIVTSGWLNEILRCAYMDDRIATVTPLSNNATICSVPHICKYNDIPPGYTIQEFSDLVGNISEELDIKCVQIPTGIGFCLFIKSGVIKEIGLFDEVYGRGYNEENDFCMRAIDNGYFHVCCTTAFVYHRGRASFKDEQVSLDMLNQKILLTRYPNYMNMVDEFVAQNPLKYIQENVTKCVEINTIELNQRFSLGIDCQLLNRDKWTGSERYTFYLIKNILMLDKKNLYVIYSKNRQIDDHLTDSNNYIRKYALDSLGIFLDSEKIDVFHKTIQCFTITDLILLLKSKTSVITILDLILYKYPAYFDTPQEAETYQILTKLSAQIADKIIAISTHAKYDIVETLRVPEEKVDVIPLAIDTRFKIITDDGSTELFKDKYKLYNEYILYLGTDFPHKNIESIIKSYKKLKKVISSPPDLVIAGPSTSIKRRKELIAQIDGDSKIKILDYVEDSDIVNLYNCSILFVYPSLYEGFGLPILEAMACGIPVIASNATSIPEVAGNAALLIDATNIDELCRSMLQVLTDSELRERLIESGINRVREFKWKQTAKNTLGTYRSAYKNSKDLREKLDPPTCQLLKSMLDKISESDRLLITDSLEQNFENISTLREIFDIK